MSTFSPFSKEELIPQTEMLEVKKQKGKLYIGLPKETLFEERRICLTPDAVSALTKYVEEVKNGKFPDEDHSYTVSDKEYESFLSMVEKRKQL